MMMTGLAIGFGLLAVLLGLILRKLIWQIRDLERQISFLEEKQSNGDVVCDIRFGGIGGLTDTLNRVFEQTAAVDPERKPHCADVYEPVS